MAVSQFFSRAAQWTSRQCGRPLTFGLAVAIVLIWAVTGPMFNYSDTWQLVINTGTTIVTFLMVFLIQNTQNRDAAAVQLKLDELIRASSSARNRLLTLEDLSEQELDQMKASFARVATQGGVGEGRLRQAEADLDNAKEDSPEPSVRAPSGSFSVITILSGDPSLRTTWDVSLADYLAAKIGIGEAARRDPVGVRFGLLHKRRPRTIPYPDKGR